MLRISFPFRLIEAGERNRTSFEREMIADISSVLGEIRVQRKRKNKMLLLRKCTVFIENI